MKEDSGFLHYLHSFRGFAILCIVAVHAGIMPLVAANGFIEPDTSDIIYVINEVLFHDSTIYFALISGLLFAAFLSDRGWKRFFRSKFLYIFLPYLFFSVLLSIGRPPSAPGESGSLHPDLGSYMSTLGLNVLYGKAMPIYWYIPVLFILYAFTPLLSLIFQGKGWVKWLGLPIMLLPLAISRQPIAFDYQFDWQNPLYFLGAYALGMWMGYQLNDSLTWIKSNKTWLTVIALLSFGLLFYLYTVEMEPLGITSLQETVHYINKLAIAALVIAYFAGKSTQPKVITWLANDAFAIYFIHFVFIFLTMSPFIPIIQNEAYYPFNLVLTIPIILVLTLALSKGLIFLLKKLFRKNSRMFIGS